MHRIPRDRSQQKTKYDFDFESFVFQRLQQNTTGIPIPELPVKIHDQGADADHLMAEFNDGDLIEIHHITILHLKAFKERNLASGDKGDANTNRNSFLGMAD